MSLIDHPHAESPARPTELSESSSLQSALEYMQHVVQLTGPDISRATGADDRTRRRWSNGGNIQSRYANSIDDLRHLVLVLSQTLPAPEIGRWLKARNRMLNSQRPIVLLNAGEYDRVLEAAEAYVVGDPM